MSVSSNSRIARNALALYFRMFVTMLIGVYTSRVILHALGVSDYGIYNVVAGFVAMFTIISGSLSASVSRFLTYELGTGNQEKLLAVFKTSLVALMGIAAIVVLAAETIGLWYLYNKMVIPPDRLNASFWCFQFSLLTLVVTLINTSYSALIIAHERMDVYAYLAILNSGLKLGICFLVLYSKGDRLILYALLLCGVSLLNQLIYMWFCRKKFQEARFGFYIDKLLFGDLFSFAGWNFIGSSAAIATSQGSNLLLNAMGGGAVVNAAFGIANNASGTVGTFVRNFTLAFTPQITKRYAAKEYQSLITLLRFASKYSYFLMFFISLPLLLNTRFVLELWLGEVPEYTIWFTRFIILENLFDSISRPLVNAKNATGKIRNYQLVVGSILLLSLPLSYIALRLGLSSISVTAIAAITSFIAVLARLYMFHGDIPGFSSIHFIRRVLLVVLVCSVVAGILPVLSYLIIPYGLTNFLVTSTICVVSTIFVVYYLGCDKRERTLVSEKVKSDIFVLKKKLPFNHK